VTGITFTVMYNLWDQTLGGIAISGITWNEAITTLYCACCAGVVFHPPDGQPWYAYSLADGNFYDQLASDNVTPNFVRETSQFIQLNGTH
jgi:hypothetical protein